MTRVGGIGSGMMPARRPVRAAGGFVLAGAGTAPGTGPAQGIASVPALLALQEQGGGERRPAGEAARRRGEAALEELSGLQLDLLRGQVDSARLERLAALAPREAAPVDAALREVLAEIALRARVELARRRVATASSR